MTDDELLEKPSRRLLRRAETLSKRQAVARREMRLIVDELRNRASLKRDPESLGYFLDCLDLLSADEMTHFDVMALTQVHRLKTIPHADSFWHSILVRRRKKQLGVVPEKYLGINKANDERFASHAGAIRVNTLFRGPFSEAPQDIRPTVLKPVKSSDSRGAFYLLENELFSIAQSTVLPDWDALVATAAKQVATQDLDTKQWEVQELVSRENTPAHDLKFYCFYGEIGAVLEIARYPKQMYAYFDGDMNPINFRLNSRPGFEDIAATNVMNGTLTEAKLAVVKDISLKIPAPFMRIDFLDAGDHLVFCEFSSAPGLSHALVPEHDQRLGAMYHRAEIRIIQDLLAGKGFDDYREFSA